MATTINLGKVVPEKGVDYFTEEEIAQFKQEATQELQEQITTNTEDISTLDIATTNIQEVEGIKTDTFDTTKQYQVGDIVIFQKKVYRCIEATTGSWNVNKWEEINIRQEQDEQNIEIKRLDGVNKSIVSNYSSNKAGGIDLKIEDCVSAPIDDIKIGDGPELEQNGEPTPSNEVTVKVVEGTANLVVQSKNIVDWANGQSTYADINWENDVLTVRGTGANLIANFSILDFVKSHPGQTLHFGYESIDLSEFSSTSVQIVSIMITDNGTNSYSTILNANGKPIDYTIPEDTSGITLARIRIASNNSNTESISKIVITNPQLELGEKSSSYTQYAKQTYPITLPTGMVLGQIDNQSSYIYGDIDNWKLHRGIVGVTLDETLDWRKYGETRYYIASSILNVMAKPQSELYCNYFDSAKTIAEASGNNKVYIGTNSSIEFYPDNDFLTQYPTVEDFKLWVAQHNLKVYYQANEPGDIDITDETLIEQLNNIKRNMTTYKGQTIVFTVTNNLYPNIDLTYKINGDIEVNEKVAVIQNEVDMLKSNFDTKTSENSDNINITDAINYTNQGDIKVGDGTELEQETTEGKNLWGGYNENTRTLSAGVTVTYNTDGTIRADGTATSSGNSANVAYATTNGLYVTLPAGNYFVSGGKSNSKRLEIYSTDSFNFGNDSGNGRLITLTETTNVIIRLAFTAEAVFNDEIMYIQIEAGESATSYEPYTGGQASPNPDYPQEIKVVEGECGVEVSNKNLWGDLPSDTHSVSGIAYTYNNDGTIYANGTATSNSNSAAVSYAKDHNLYVILEAGNYFVSGGKSNDKYLQIYTTDGVDLGSDRGNGCSFILTEKTSILIRLSITSGTIVDNEIFYIQLEQNSISTSYTPHKEQTYPITLPEGIFLGSIGEASNYIYGEKDNWKLHSGLAKVLLDTSYSWGKSTNTSIDRFTYGAFGRVTGITKINKSNYFKKSVVGQTVVGTIRLNDNQIVVDFSDYGTATLEQFKEWLSSHEVYVYGELTTPTETDITDTTLISQLNNIADNLQTYKDGTIVITSGENLAPNIQFDYLQNPFSSIEARLDLLEA